MLVVMTNEMAIKTRLLRSSLLWLWLHRKNAKIRVIVKIKLPSRRKIPAVNRNLSLNSCFVLLRVKSTYSLTVACIGLGGHWIQWCRSLLNIGGDNLQFYPKFALFSTLGEWTSTTILFRCGNLLKTKRKMKTEHFFSPNSGEDQKKKGLLQK